MTAIWVCHLFFDKDTCKLPVRLKKGYRVQGWWEYLQCLSQLHGTIDVKYFAFLQAQLFE